MHYGNIVKDGKWQYPQIRSFTWAVLLDFCHTYQNVHRYNILVAINNQLYLTIFTNTASKFAQTIDSFVVLYHLPCYRSLERVYHWNWCIIGLGEHCHLWCADWP